MGTRATVHIYEGTEHLVSLYKQFDGYTSGLGAELAEFVLSGKLVNGIPGVSNEKGPLYFNGAGCFTAALIAKLKDGPGNLYVIPDKNSSEEYNYTVWVPDIREINGGKTDIEIACEGCRTISRTKAAKFLEWANRDDEEDS